jgi:hypothetical protein
MNHLHVVDVSGKNAITQEDGQKIYALVVEQLKAGDEIQLDFQGVEIFASPFFNTAIGQLMKDFNADDLNRLLKFKALSVVGQQVLQRVIENSRKYFSSSEDYRKAQTEVLMKLAAES